MANVRHVLMTADAVGGVWQYALDLAEGLRKVLHAGALGAALDAHAEEQVARAIEGKGSVPVDPADAVGGLRLIDIARQSASEGLEGHRRAAALRWKQEA